MQKRRVNSFSFRKCLLAASALLFAFALNAAENVNRPLRLGAPPSAPSTFSSDLYRVEKQVLQAGEEVGSTIQYLIRIQALGDLDRVRIIEEIPAGLQFVSASPEPNEKKGRTLLWDWPSMARNTTTEITVTARTTDEGWYVANTKIAVVPSVGLPLFSGRPRLELIKTGPEQAELGDDINFQLTVINAGNAPAHDVIIADTLPPGLYAMDGSRSGNVVTYKVGTLAIGESRTVDVPVKAAIKGEWVNTANAYSTHKMQANASARISVVESKVSISKRGPSRAYVFAPGNYTIQINNEGDSVLTNVTLTDQVPEGMRFISASDGGRLEDSYVKWLIPRLEPGASAHRSLRVTGTRPSTVTTTAMVRIATGRTDSASTTTEWEGAPGVLTEIVDDVDPVRVGNQVNYAIKITSQGALRGFNCDATFEISPNMRFVRVTGGYQAQVIGNRVIIKNLTLNPLDVITFNLVTETLEPGLGSVSFKLDAEFLSRSVVKEEATNIY